MKFSNISKRAARGFTLIELVIVIAVIAILAALLVPTILGQAERARMSRAKGDVSQIAMSIARLRTDTSVTTAVCLTNTSNLTLATAPADCRPDDGTGSPVASLQSCQDTTLVPGYVCWGGPYMTNILPDPWSAPYKVNLNTDNGAIEVYSNGPDKRTGSTFTADDISYIQ
jgi:general secretion pathway protein G